MAARGQASGVARRLATHGLRLGYRLGEASARISGRPRPRIVFLHIPKCAGSTVTDHFRRRVGTIRSGRMVYLFDAQREDWERRVQAASRARYVAGHFGGATAARIAGGAFLFTFLRDPRARLRSHFRFFSAIDRPGERLPTRTYLDFLTADDPRCREGRDNVITRQLAVAYALDLADAVPRAEWPARARETLRRIDFVGFQDRLAQDFPALLRRLGLRRPRAVGVVNATAGLPQRGIKPAPDLDLDDAVLAAEERCLDMDLALWRELRGDAA